MRRVLALFAGLAATALMVAAPLHADPQSEYLDALAAQGFELTPAKQQRLVNFGKIACDDIRNGGEDLAFRHLDSFPGTNPDRVQIVVSTAHQKLCPGA